MSTSSGFPLLKLPLLALETLVNLMSPDTVLELVLLSQVFKSRISIVKWKIESLEWMITYYRIAVIIKSNFGRLVCDIKTRAEFDGSPYLNGIQVESINLNGTTVSLAKLGGWYLISETLEDSNECIKFKSELDTLENLTKFLMSFVKCSKFKLEYSLEEMLLSKDFYVWQYVRGNPIDLEVHRTFGNALVMTPDDLKFMFENLKFGYLDLRGCVSETNFKYHGLLEAEEMIIDWDNSWIELKSLNCQKVEIYSFPDDSEQIKQILKNWVQGSSMEKLEFLKISHQGSFSLDEMLKSLKHENTSFSREDISKPIGHIYKGTVLGDIQRESDGRWGTLCIESLWYFYFIVWTPEKLKECCQETKIKLGLE